MNKKYTVIGASGQGKVVIEIIEACQDLIDRIIDDDPSKKDIIGYEVSDKHIYATPVIVAIGDNYTRKLMTKRINHLFGTAVHPKTAISTRTTIGEGSVIMAGVTINSSCKIGRHCIVNTNSSIDHDCVISDFVHISPGSSLAGNITIGEGTTVGTGTSIIPGIKIGKWVTIGAGTVVTKDIPDNAVVVGVPGKIIKYNKDEK